MECSWLQLNVAQNWETLWYEARRGADIDFGSYLHRNVLHFIKCDVESSDITLYQRTIFAARVSISIYCNIIATIHYVYKPTSCTNFPVIRLYFSLDVHALHVPDCISPSSGATFYKLYMALRICRYMPMRLAVVWLVTLFFISHFISHLVYAGICRYVRLLCGY